jgi:cytochrome c-type biogenesis protein CcsB
MARIPLLILCLSLLASFARGAELAELERATVQHRSTLKTLDTLSRQVFDGLSGRSKIDGQPPVETLFDMTYRPSEYATRPFIKIKHLPLRQDIADALQLDKDERHQFLKLAKVSPAFLADEELRTYLRNLAARDLTKAQAIGELLDQAETAEVFLETPLLPPLSIVPPAPGDGSDGKWHTLPELLPLQVAILDVEPAALMTIYDAARATEEAVRLHGESAAEAPATRLASLLKNLDEDQRSLALEAAGLLVQSNVEQMGYDVERLLDVAAEARALRAAWLSEGDVEEPSAALAASLVAVNSEAYPSELKRKGEVVYNRLGGLTLPGTALYFVALVAFLVSAYGAFPKLRIWGIRFMLVALLVHTLAIVVRWWLVEKSTNDWFHSIPIKNQFESVMFSAWFGAIVGLVLELRRKKAGGGVFGAAAAFVGFLSLLALFASPYVFGRDIGGQLSQVSGILMSYWLYVHVTTVVASYALIGMSFLLGVWYLVAARTEAGNRVSLAPAGGEGFFKTLGRTFFLPVDRREPAGAFTSSPDVPMAKEKTLLQRLDAAQVVVMQLAFGLLGVGIILGAVWADQSWGRPWGWDPKETFALVTWIVYLIILHVRLVTKRKAMWTAILAIIGFAIMLFNWIGVNFFLVGLHSYA